MLTNCKKSIKIISYSFLTVLVSVSYLEASFSAEELGAAKKSLSKNVEHTPKGDIQRPNLGNIISVRILEKAKGALSKGAEHLPEVEVQRPKLGCEWSCKIEPLSWVV